MRLQTRNPRRTMRRSLLLVLGLMAPQAAGVPAAPGPPALTLDALLEKFRRMPGLEARFREERRIALLAAPLVTEGTIHFAPPARLARHTSGPALSSVVVDGRRLSFGDAATREDLDLDANPVLRDYVNSFLQILEGDREGLVSSWRIEIAGRDEQWEMKLQPLSEPVRRTIREMTLKGGGTVVRWMKIAETTGDETVTEFFEVNPSRRYTQDEIDRLFRIQPR